jgi:hypothetical protein
VSDELIEPIPPPRYEPPRSEAATARPGPTAPHASGGGIPDVDGDTLHVIERARQLFRMARLPRADAEWPHLKPHLLVAEARLTRVVRDCPDHDSAGALLQEVRRYLGRHA